MSRVAVNTARMGNWLWAVTILVVMIIISLPTVMITMLGLLPSAVAYLCDRSEEKFATFCVGGLNLCGVFPYFLQIWFENHSISTAVDIITNVFALVIMYSGAGLGWALFISIPPVISAFLTVIAQRRLQFLHASQADIIEEWGQSVTDQGESEEMTHIQPEPSA